MKIGLKKIFAVAGILILGIGIGVGGMVLKAKVFPDENAKVVYVEKKPTEIGPLIELKEFIVNLDGGGMIKAEIALEGVNGKAEEKIKAKEIFLRDRIIAVLGSKSFADIRSSKARETLKSELVTELNEVCDDQIKDVFFNSFLYSL